MSTTDPLPYGSWPSPITAARLVEGAAGVSEVRVDGTDIWWNEQRPSEGGRSQLVRLRADGATGPSPGSGPVIDELFPGFVADGGRNWNARTAVMEYGGGAWNVRGGVVVFADWADQRLHRAEAGSDPQPITPEPAVARGQRWSEPTWLDDDWLVCVREDHDPDRVAVHGEAVNELVAVPLDGSAVDDPSLVRVLVSGADFVHSPAVGRRAGQDLLAWVEWDHPAMPWDATTVVVGQVVRDETGAPTGVAARVEVAGGPAESVVQPGFSSTGDLLFCTDRTGWWNPWRVEASALDRVIGETCASGGSGASGGPGEVGASDGRALAEPVIAGGGVEVEVGGGLWVGGLRWWAEVDGGALVVSATRGGADRLASIDVDGTFAEISTPFTEISQVVQGAETGTVLVVAASPTTEAAPYRISLRVDEATDDEGTGSLTGDRVPNIERLRPARELGIDGSWISRPRHVSFPSGPAERGGRPGQDVGEGIARTAHALYYAPNNPGCTGLDGELPPLVVMIHGGPTSAARNRLDLAKQFWTSRGFAVVDVNYGGSTGYGRGYRALLDGAWGVVDVEDAVSAARHLAAEGLVDVDRLAIRGGSAGGYTTLAALCFHDTFRAGASHYGVADLSALAADTHKFESRYLDGLVGPWPESRATYESRSPIHHTDGFDQPLIVLQGSEDEVVPPNQAEMIVGALAAKGVPHAYLLFEGEQHGFRQAANIVRALEAELWFYGRVFGFDPADRIDPVEGAVGL